MVKLLLIMGLFSGRIYALENFLFLWCYAAFSTGSYFTFLYGFKSDYALRWIIRQSLKFCYVYYKKINKIWTRYEEFSIKRAIVKISLQIFNTFLLWNLDYFKLDFYINNQLFALIICTHVALMRSIKLKIRTLLLLLQYTIFKWIILTKSKFHYGWFQYTEKYHFDFWP